MRKPTAAPEVSIFHVQLEIGFHSELRQVDSSGYGPAPRRIADYLAHPSESFRLVRRFSDAKKHMWLNGRSRDLQRMRRKR